MDLLADAGCHPQGVRQAFVRDSDYDRLADAACGRSRADWLVGMNLSRAYSLRLQRGAFCRPRADADLAMIVDRELALRSFVPEDYLEVVATFQARETGQGKL